MTFPFEHDNEHRPAEAVARWMHRTQFDKRGVLYVCHLEAVADAVSESATAAAWLHDVVEDTPLTMRTIRHMFSPVTADAVDLLTHRPKKRTYFNYIHLIQNAEGKAGEIAREVKIADLRHNLSPDRRFPNDQSIYRRHEKALRILDTTPLTER